MKKKIRKHLQELEGNPRKLGLLIYKDIVSIINYYKKDILKQKELAKEFSAHDYPNKHDHLVVMATHIRDYIKLNGKEGLIEKLYTDSNNLTGIVLNFYVDFYKQSRILRNLRKKEFARYTWRNLPNLE